MITDGAALQATAAAVELSEAALSVRTGAMPEARRMLELGQCAMPMPRSAKRARSSASSMQQCANQQSFSSQPISLLGCSSET